MLDRVFSLGLTLYHFPLPPRPRPRPRPLPALSITLCHPFYPDIIIMRAIPLFLLVALASLGKTQPTISDKSGLRTILDCMDNPAGEDNVAEKAFVEHWKDVVAGWGSRGTKQLEREVDMRVSMNTCAAIYGDPTIGSINTDPWRNFFKDLINIAATMFCARHTPLGLEVCLVCIFIYWC